MKLSFNYYITTHKVLSVRDSCWIERPPSPWVCASRCQTRERTHISLGTHQAGGLWIAARLREDGIVVRIANQVNYR